MMSRGLIAAALCAALSACTVQPRGSAEPPIDDQSMSAPQQPDEAAASPGRQPEPQQAAIDPANLVGMTGERITALFGTPVFVRRDPPGEFWRYRGQTCVLELFFYLQGGRQRVDHIETRSTGRNMPDRDECVAKLRKPPVRG